MKKALIIEDTEDNWVLISALLQHGGYETDLAKTGSEGFKMFMNNLYDLVILDIKLPDINGDEVLKKIKAEKKDLKVPIIAMTSYAMNGDRENLLALGCTGYIEKPINPLYVLKEIEQILKDKS